MFRLLVRDVMCEHPIKVKENVNIAKVAHLLLRYRINGILVVKKNNNSKLVGIFTTGDLLRLINDVLSQGTHRIEHLKKIAKIPVGKVASKGVISIQKNVKFTKAIAMMHKKNVYTIPVYDADILVGVIGRHDILNSTLNYY